MRKIPVLLIGTTLVASPLAMAGPVVLTDQQLERVSAGSSNYENGGSAGSGGAIVGNYSSASLTTSGDVTLKDGVQQGARAVNLVNSAESGVANGVNVWDGRIKEVGAATVLDVTQANSITQDQSRTASLKNYARTDANIDRDYSEWSLTTHKGSVDTKQEISSSSDLPGVDVQVGKGVSIAGEADLHIDAGSLEISTDVVLGRRISRTYVEVAGAAVQNTVDNTLASANTSFSWTLPEVDFAAKGAGCWVVMGRCDADGSYETTVTEKTITHAPFSLDYARAENIVLDGSTLDTNTSYSVSLAGSAQSDARAVNLANAAGSVIANSVNISRTPTVGPNLNLSQVNTIVQRR
jgi:hypothetical protein